ncbi:proline-rich receptor-like protein kinase PERK8 isoform X2 [Perca fluviatilis]|uniref:proline-rich receptor-like protein kinase PERK8 isoform X2 n=1 Tax=Perca fluviatilis TaxID=8168 RepID=UPI001965E6E0|nr:proline-rich receptor-like protein kinase PERK8 isoform X2 [Perca fluviatilis]
MRPTPTSGPQEVTVEVHRTSSDQGQQTEPVGDELGEPAPPSTYPPPPSFPSFPSLLSPLSSSPLLLPPLTPPPFNPSPDTPLFCPNPPSSSSHIPSCLPRFQVPAGPAVTPGILKGGPTTPVPLAITISDIETLERNALNRPATTPTSLAITISDVETPEKKSLNRTKEC